MNVIESLFKIYERKVDIFLLAKVLFVQLTEDEDSVCGTSTWYESKLHGINTNLGSDQGLNNTFNDINIFKACNLSFALQF